MLFSSLLSCRFNYVHPMATVSGSAKAEALIPGAVQIATPPNIYDFGADRRIRRLEGQSVKRNASTVKE